MSSKATEARDRHNAPSCAKIHLILSQNRRRCKVKMIYFYALVHFLREGICRDGFPPGIGWFSTSFPTACSKLKGNFILHFGVVEPKTRFFSHIYGWIFPFGRVFNIFVLFHEKTNGDVFAEGRKGDHPGENTVGSEKIPPIALPNLHFILEQR